MAKQGTYREQSPKLTPQGVTIVDFRDTKPNHVVVTNTTPETLYVSDKSSVHPNAYKLKIPPGARRLFSRETGMSHFAIYFSGGTSYELYLESYEDVYNSSSVSESTESSTVVEMAGAVDVSSLPPTPAGNNNIGRVNVDQLPPLPAGTNTIGNVGINNFPSLPAGVNNIGKVEVSKLPSLPAGLDHIGQVSVPSGVAITSMPPIEVSSNPVRAEHQAYEATVTTTAVKWQLAEGKNLVALSYIANDGDTDLFVSFNADVVTAAPGNGTNGVFRLKAGEALSDFTRMCTAINFIRATGTGLVRVLGV